MLQIVGVRLDVGNGASDHLRSFKILDLLAVDGGIILEKAHVLFEGPDEVLVSLLGRLGVFI